MAPAGDDEADAPRFLAVSVGGQACALELADVREIIRVPRVFPVPLSPPRVEGLVNLRGQVLPVISAGGALRNQAVAGDRARVVVLNLEPGFGLLVDTVDGVVGGEAERLPAAADDGGDDLLAGTLHAGDLVMNLLDPHRLALPGAAPAADVVAPPALDTGERGAGGGEAAAQYLVFVVGGQEYALPVMAVREIGRMPETLSRVAGSGAHWLGVATLRGRLLPVVDLGLLLDLPSPPAERQPRVLVVGGPGGRPVGLRVDRVREVLESESEPERLPPVWERPDDADLHGMLSLDGGERLVAVLAVERLLQRALAHYDAEGAMDAEIRSGGDEAGEEFDSLVVFALGEQEFAVPVESVREILRVPEQLARVPGAVDFIEGMINLRGQVLSVVDLRRRLGLPGAVRSPRQRILVVDSAGGQAGITVDRVREVLRVPRASLGAAPSMAHMAELVTRVSNLTEQQRMLLVLDPARLAPENSPAAQAA